MSWPDLTLVPEGVVTAVAWRAGGAPSQTVRFLENGVAYVRSDEVERELRRFIHEVLDRLEESGRKTALSEEWSAVTAMDEQEAAFARAAARLGLDPYSLPESVADDIVAISEELDVELLDEFLDSANPTSLRTAVQWLTQAREVVREVAVSEPIDDLRRELHTGNQPVPYLRGYALARELRRKLDLSPTEPVDLAPLVSNAVLQTPSGGLEGFVRADDHVRLVLPGAELSPSAVRFAEGRSLGLALAGSRSDYLLDPARTDSMKQARAFAAELLAPAEGIATFLAELPASTDAAFEAIARRFQASALLVRRQYENQLSAGHAFD
ncbi:hypothetical protein ABFU82_24320 [Nocardioides sp. WV_118_6]